MATSDGVKLCKDCKHAIPNATSDAWWRCAKTMQPIPQNSYERGLALVTGKGLEPGTMFDCCDLCRCPGGKCGPEGKMWEPK